MLFYNINQAGEKASLKDAVLKSIGSGSGLYMPENIPLLDKVFFEKLPALSLPEIAYEVSEAMLAGDIPPADLRRIVEEAFVFPIPLKQLDEGLFALELFHGPTLAFKDVGARFMAGLFEYFLQGQNREAVILAATSGDTGAAVANAFFNKKGVKVVILYPSGKVSGLQEKQLTTMGGNIVALEVEGNFDDCQKMVKQAFDDAELNRRLNLTSANSINFGRLFPQSFYYFHALGQLGAKPGRVTVSVPSGNFGNLTAGLIAKKMGLNVGGFVAATNENRSVPDYLASGRFSPGQTRHTISNAMDVGNPSNFPRMLELYKKQHAAISGDIKGYSFNDGQTRAAMAELQNKYGYQADPHGAVGYAGLLANGLNKGETGVFLETAHPAKFPEEVEKATGKPAVIPKALLGIMSLEKKSCKIPAEYKALADCLMR